MKFKKGQNVRITTGKFRGIRGRIYNKEKEKGITYYDIHAREKRDRKGKSYSTDLIGLGAVVNIEEKQLELEKERKYKKSIYELKLEKEMKKQRKKYI